MIEWRDEPGDAKLGSESSKSQSAAATRDSRRPIAISDWLMVDERFVIVVVVAVVAPVVAVVVEPEPTDAVIPAVVTVVAAAAAIMLADAVEQTVADRSAESAAADVE